MSGWKTAGLFVGVVVLFAAAIVGSAIKGEPDPLPGAALGWPVLLHVERAAAILGAAGAVGLVGWKAAHGEFPIKFGALEYPAKEADAEAKKATAAQEERLQSIEAILGIGPPPS
jgi:hypothetical protein